MQNTLDKRGAHLVGAAVLALGALAAALLPLALWQRLAVALLPAAGAWLYARLALGAARWGVQQGALCMDTGLLFPRQTRLRLEDVTALWVVYPPFGRPAGLCLLAVQGAGSLHVLYAARTRDADMLERLWRALP